MLSTAKPMIDAIGLGLLQQLAAFGMHGDGQVVVLAHLPQARDMVDMGVGQQNHDGHQPLHVSIYCVSCASSNDASQAGSTMAHSFVASSITR